MTSSIATTMYVSTLLNDTLPTDKLTFDSGSQNGIVVADDVVSPTANNEEMDRDEYLARIEIATLAIIFLVTLLGNGTVLLALWTRRRYFEYWFYSQKLTPPFW